MGTGKRAKIPQSTLTGSRQCGTSKAFGNLNGRQIANALIDGEYPESRRAWAR